jgi:hypothetical protein
MGAGFNASMVFPLPPERVRVRGRDMIAELSFPHRSLLSVGE